MSTTEERTATDSPSNSVTCSGGPAAWDALHEHITLALRDLGKAWIDREKKPIHADVEILSVARRLRAISSECGVQLSLSIEAEDLLRMADDLFATLQGKR